MKQRKLPIVGYKDPCDICLVRVTCHVLCEDLQKYISCIWRQYTYYNSDAWVRTLRELIDYVEVEYPDLHASLNRALGPGKRRGTSVKLDHIYMYITYQGKVFQSNSQAGTLLV